MRHIRIILFSLFGVMLFQVANAHIGPSSSDASKKKNANDDRLNYRENCANASARTEQSINNVRAILTTGGDVWWDGNNGRYVVPKVPPGVPEVSSIFAGAVWLGGLDPADNLKVAAQTYGRGRANARFDYFTGPLDPETGKTDQETCADWDKFFKVTGANIDQHLANYQAALEAGVPYNVEDIPQDVLGWPGRGNEFFRDVHRFDPPDTRQGLAGFFDQDGDGDYNPERGDYPIIEIRGCPIPQYPDEMIFWIYNDAGNIHAESGGDPIQMEVQVQAFSYATNDEINDMSFQRYKLINRAIESIDSTFFAMWVDPDLGCSSDDYVGCDTLRSMAYVYNQDALDGEEGCTCPGGVNTYCEEIPLLGVDYFRGPLDENGGELGMSSFTYSNRADTDPAPAPGTTDPENAVEYYRYLSGSWKDGSPFTFGADAYQQPTFNINYAFTEAPDNTAEGAWSMCTQGLPPGDRRTIQASGPFRLDPGAVNELIIGVVWVADQRYPCPSITKLQEADDIAQALFDNCFEITDGPDAPDIDFIELDQEIIAVLTNDELLSNNAFEAYAQPGLQIPPLAQDSLYTFEGYKIYQLSGADVTIADVEDPDKARLIFQVDIKNGVDRVFNWETIENPTEEEVYVPTLEVEGADQGIRHTFRITQDQFAEGDRRLINHKKYYFVALAYAHNEYSAFDPQEVIGQRRPYLEGRRNIGDGFNPFYTVIPRPIVDRTLNSEYGDGAVITRIEGIGNGGNFLRISEETRQSILDGSFDGELTYEPGGGPIDIQIFNPLDVVDGEFELTFVDEDMDNNELDNDVRWTLKNLSDPNAPVISAERSIENLNEQIIKEYGFTVSIGQVADAGDQADASNGAIGVEIEYPTSATQDGWLSGIDDGLDPTVFALDDDMFNYIRTGPGQPDDEFDTDPGFRTFGPGAVYPFFLNYFKLNGEFDLPFISPAWMSLQSSVLRNDTELQDLNNVDIVLTSDKSKWSRCVVVETANRYYEREGLIPELGNANSVDNFDLRQSPNVTKDAGPDGLPAVDTEDPGFGMGWFPGYAVDVETGQRLNIFFGENSVYDGTILPEFYQSAPNGRDMMFNPTSQIILNPGIETFTVYNYMGGGQHYVYVTNTPYDSCADLRNRLAPEKSTFTKLRGLRAITWSAYVIPNAELGFTNMNTYAEGLIPQDVVVKLRVNNPYQVDEGTGDFNGYPTYRFKIEGKQATTLTEVEVEDALDMINVVPNPYRGFSDYETSQFTTTVKITNLPAKCTVTIYSLDGKFIRQYKRDERGVAPPGSNRAIETTQIIPDIEWDLRNNKGIPIASGVYLIHVAADGLGDRTIKWFGVNRQFDPTGL